MCLKRKTTAFHFKNAQARSWNSLSGVIVDQGDGFGLKIQMLKQAHNIAKDK